ncbi:hypothetical protein EUAN_20230 [Andreesenia angusta]|uniref:S1 motif domain-containing protein n=1 Tax=Andreesenia angusta TaxID=39480 RepID=A0A1S1V573_9FIRM|nr:Tex family protein [Andreesenia angusta]OHW61585.1 hypothetical protein EUAN_20230 [Andreesenia angusta]
MDILKQLQDEFRLKPFQVNNTVKLIDEGNTIPFIARYRKEQTGTLDDVTLRELDERLSYLRNLEGKKEEIKRHIEEQGSLTEELTAEIEKATTIQRLEDLYRPYRPKRRTRATMAKEKGLDSLADLIFSQSETCGDIAEIASGYIDSEKGVSSAEEALAGAMDIMAEMISDDPAHREVIRKKLYEESVLETSEIPLKDGEEESKKTDRSTYEMYFSYTEPVKKVPSHRVLAINRAEAEKVIKVKLSSLEETIVPLLKARIVSQSKSLGREYLEESIADSYKRLIFPSVEREIRNELTESAEAQAIKVFGLNLQPLLLQAPIKDKVVMGFDPAYRTGCKLAVVDGTGKLLEYTTIYPTQPQNKVAESKATLASLVEKHGVDIIAIGNGTGSRESEAIVSELITEMKRELYYTIVNEAGASIYSASALGAKEYPDVDVSIRGAISIARRLQDPLAELVKIDPKHIGVGQYQHDLNQSKLDETLKNVVEDSVNSVGVDLNTASSSLLGYVSGISASVAKNICDYREENGKFESRSELLKVKRLGKSTFVQCAGFLRISGGKNILDYTGVHPESYDATEKLLEKLSVEKSDSGLKSVDWEPIECRVTELASELGIGEITLSDIISELKKPGRDPREDMPAPVFRTDVLKMEDLKPGMVLTGTVRNVVDFGAFVDIGVKQDGLVHISQLSDRYVKNPMDVVAVGDNIEVKVLEIDLKKQRIALSRKDI